MKYSIAPVGSHKSTSLSANPARKIWQVCNRMKVLKEFEDENDAVDYVQQLVENDAWHAANR